MERYCNSFGADVKKWEDIIKSVEQLPFECVHLLGHGEQCSVHTITPVSPPGSYSSDSDSETPNEIHWTEDYFRMNDVEGAFSDDDDSSSSEGDVSEVESETSEKEWTSVAEKESSPFPSPSHHLTIITPSPMGCVEVVAKRFSHLKEDVCYQGCHSTTKAQLILESSCHKYLEWMMGRTEPEPVETNVLSQRITPTEASYNGFITESLCHLLITDLVARGLTPHITMAFRSVQCRNTGYLIQERISGTLEETLESDPNIGVRELAALYFQIIFTLHVMQAACRLKHHDLHTDNVFIKVIDDDTMWKGRKLKDVTHFEYRLDANTVVYLPNSGYLVKIGDFGMSSLDVYGRRIQRLDMETYSKGTGWGEWCSTFDRYEGYDTQMLMGAPPFDNESWRVKDEPTATFLRHLRRVSQGPCGKLTRSRLRPMPGHVSRVTPLEVLHAVFIEDPGEMYTFTTRPPDADSCVLCLGDLGDLSTAPPIAPGRKRKRHRRRKVVVPPPPPPPSLRVCEFGLSNDAKNEEET